MKRTRRIIPVPPWWPPKRGDKLRMRENGTEYLCHVVAVFRHNGTVNATVGYFGKHRQWWHYEVLRPIDAYYGRVWPDVQPRPTRPYEP